MAEEKDETTNISSGIPTKVFMDFFDNLEKSEIPKNIILALRKTIIENGNLSESDIRKALFSADEKQ